MLIDKKKVLFPIKVIGWFTMVVIFIPTIYFRGDYDLKTLITYGLMSTPFIAMASWFWRQKLSYQKIESSFGTLFFTKSKVYTDLQSIELTNSLVQAGSGPDIHLLSVGIKISGRKEIFNLRNDLAKLTEQDAANLIKEMAKITGISTINASKSFHDIYERVFKNQFKLADVNVNNY